MLKKKTTKKASGRYVGCLINTLSVSSQQHIHLTQYLLLFFYNLLPCDSRRLWALLVGFPMKSFFSLCQPSSGLLTVKVLKRLFPWTSPSALSVPLKSDGHGAAPGLPHWRLSAAWQEILAPWAVLAAPVCIYEARRVTWWDGFYKHKISLEMSPGFQWFCLALMQKSFVHSDWKRLLVLMRNRSCSRDLYCSF